jgi:iron-sulfur cluster repair protein YtfE (RIC family)
MTTGYGPTASPRGITARLTVNEMMEQWPAAIPAMRDYGMQPGCCGGLTLAAVEERDNLKLDQLLDMLRGASSRGNLRNGTNRRGPRRDARAAE